MAERMREYKKKYPIIRISVAKEIMHGICVSNLAYRIGKEMNFSQEECYDLAVAGFLHDIGKMELVKYVYGHEEETLTIEEIKYVRDIRLWGRTPWSVWGIPQILWKW